MFDIKTLALLKHGKVWGAKNIVESALLNKWGGGASYEKTVGPAPILSISDAKAKAAKSLIVGIEPIQDLHGYDSPWPAGGGANLLDLDMASYNELAYGLTVARDGDGVRITGTATQSGNLSFNLIENYSGETLGGKGYVLQVFDVTAGYTVGGVWGFRTESERAFAISLNGITNGQVVDCFMRLSVAATSQTAWSPYSNECPITGRTGVTVERTGKNQLDVESITWNSGLRDGSGTPTPSSSSHYTSEIPVFADTQYTISGTLTGPSKTWRVYYLQTDGTWIERTGSLSSEPKTITTPANCGKIQIQCNTSFDLSDVQIEYGDQATEFEAYRGTTYPVTWQDEAGTVYGCTVDPVSGVLTVTHGISTLDGTGSWSLGSYSNFRFPVSGMAHIDADVSGLYCTAIKPIAYNDRGSETMPCVMGADSNNIEIRNLSGLGITTVDELKTWLADMVTAGNPVQIVYPLATPKTYQLTPQQIQLLKGSNVLWSDADELTLTYIGTTPANLLGGMLGLGGAQEPTEETSEESEAPPDEQETEETEEP